MDFTNNQTIIQRIQPQCDALPQRMKDAKNAQHKTNQSVADATGVPLSTVAKFFSGMLSNPGVFGVAAMCIDLELSLDNLMGITQEQPGEDMTHVMELELKLQSAQAQVELLKKHSDVLEAGIRERKPLLLGLLILCGILFVVLLAYLVMDMGNLSFGFVQDESHIPTAIIVLLGAAAAIALGAVQVFSKYKTKPNKKDDSIEIK